MTFKRICVSICIIMICIMIFFGGYMKTAAYYSYADSTTDQWTQVTTNEQLVEAFKYYCKSRDLTIEGSVADGVTTFTTKTFNGICNTLGIDVTALQAHLKYETDGNLGTRFLFDTFGINAYNQIFAQFLQDNELSVGDSANKQVYSGRSFIDDQGNSCLVYEINTSSRYDAGGGNADYITEGTAYKHDWKFYEANRSNFDETNSFLNISYTMHYVYNNNGTYWGTSGKSDVQSSTVNFYYDRSDILPECGQLAIVFNKYNNTLWLSRVGVTYRGNPSKTCRALKQLGVTAQELENDVPITVINIVSNTINNNTYEGDTIINNNGTTGDDDNNDEPDIPEYNPYPDGGGTITPPGSSGGGSGDDDTTITFPDFDFDFPEIDWSLGDLSEKFPFSIPFDLIAFFTVLNAEPQAPAIDAEIPLGTWYTWQFEADFSQFDNWAVIIRNVEFIAFCVGLIYLTIRLVKG